MDNGSQQVGLMYLGRLWPKYRYTNTIIALRIYDNIKTLDDSKCNTNKQNRGPELYDSACIKPQLPLSLIGLEHLVIHQVDPYLPNVCKSIQN